MGPWIVKLSVGLLLSLSGCALIIGDSNRIENTLEPKVELKNEQADPDFVGPPERKLRNK
jgi:hypothetical protein